MGCKCAIRRVQVNQDGLKLNDTHHLLVYADDDNIMGRSICTVKKNTEAWVYASRVTGLEVNTGKTKNMVMSQDQNAGWSHNMRIGNRSFERVEHFKYLGTIITNQNSIQEEIKSRSKSGNACYHLVQNLLSSSSLSKNIKITLYRSIILPVILYWIELSVFWLKYNMLRPQHSGHWLWSVLTWVT